MSTRGRDVSLKTLNDLLFKLSGEASLNDSAGSAEVNRVQRPGLMCLPYAVSGGTRSNLVMLPAYIVDHQTIRTGFLPYLITIVQDRDGMTGFKIVPNSTLASSDCIFDLYEKINFAFIEAGLPVIIDDTDDFIIEALGKNHVMLRHCRIALAKDGKYLVQGVFEDRDQFSGMGLCSECQNFDVILDVDHPLVVEILARFERGLSRPLAGEDVILPVFEEFVTPPEQQPAPSTGRDARASALAAMTSRIPGRL